MFKLDAFVSQSSVGRSGRFFYVHGGFSGCRFRLEHFHFPSSISYCIHSKPGVISVQIRRIVSQSSAGRPGRFFYVHGGFSGCRFHLKQFQFHSSSRYGSVSLQMNALTPHCPETIITSYLFHFCRCIFCSRLLGIAVNEM